MKEFYSVENPIKVHNGKKWLAIKNKDLRNCLTIDPATTDDVYSLVVFSSYEDALKAALDGVKIAPEGTAANKKVSLTTEEQFPIFKWQFNAEESDIKDDPEGFKLEDGSIVKAYRIESDLLTPASASLVHVNASRFKEVAFAIPEVSSDEDNEASAKVEETKTQPQRAQAEVKNPTEDKAAEKIIAKPLDDQPKVKTIAKPSAPTPDKAKTGFLRDVRSSIWSFMTRPSILLGGAAYAVTEYGPEIIKSTIPDVPYVGDAIMAASATAAVVEAGVGIYKGVQQCKKPATELEKFRAKLNAAKSDDEIDAILAKREKAITTAKDLATSSAKAVPQATATVVDKKKDNKTVARI